MNLWIQSHQTLLHHHKTLKLTRLLGVPKMQVIGHLHALWWWSVDNAPSGDLSHIEPEELAAIASWEGEPGIFVNSLLAAGFLDPDMSIHDWAEYTGGLIQHWRRDAERKRKERATRKTSGGRFTQEALFTDRPTDVLPSAQASHGLDRELDILPEGSMDNSDAAVADSGFEDFFTTFWVNYPSRNGKKVGKALSKDWLRSHIRAEDRPLMLRAVRNYTRGVNAGYHRDPMRFLKGDYWRDWVEPATPHTNGATPRGGLDAGKYTDPQGAYFHIFNKGDTQ